MTLATFSIEIFLVYLLQAGLFRVLRKQLKSHYESWLQSGTEFRGNVFNSLKLTGTVGTWESIFSLTLCSGLLRTWTVRRVDFTLALVNLSYLFSAMIMSIFGFIFSWWGLFSEVNKWTDVRAGGLLTATLMDQAWTGVGCGFALGLGISMIIRRSGISVLLGSIFIFHQAISVPAAGFLVFGELLGLWLLGIAQSRSTSFGNEVYTRFVCFMFSLMLFLMFGKNLLDLTIILADGVFHRQGSLFFAYLCWVILVIGFLVTDLTLSLTVLHFFYGRFKEKVVELKWPSFFMIKNWLPDWPYHQWAQIALERKLNLEQQVLSIQESNKALLPASILRQTYAEISAAEKFMDQIRP